MLSRLVLPSLLAGAALALACGPRSHTEASSRGVTSAHASIGDVATATRAARAKRATRDGDLVPSLRVTAQDGVVLFALDVENAGRKTVELHFPNGQTHDFVVHDAAGRVVWQWADGRMFTQAHRTEVIAGGDTLRVEERWTAPAGGRYTVTAIVRSSNFPVEQQAAFTVD